MNIPPQILDAISSYWNKNGWIIIFVSIALVIGFTSILFLGKDNIIEQDIEIFIENETGINVDLSP